MELNKYLQGWKDFIGKMNEKGIPVPTIRDPKTGFGSISLTLVFISSLLVIIGIVGKWSAKLGDIDMANAMQFFWTACALYWGRKFQSKDGSTFGDIGQADVKSNPIASKLDNPDA